MSALLPQAVASIASGQEGMKEHGEHKDGNCKRLHSVGHHLGWASCEAMRKLVPALLQSQLSSSELSALIAMAPCTTTINLVLTVQAADVLQGLQAWGGMRAGTACSAAPGNKRSTHVTPD